MQEQNRHWTQLLDRYLHGTATSQETAELFIWLRETDPDSISQLEELMERHYADAFSESGGLTEADSERILHTLLQKTSKSRSPRIRRIWYRVAAASAVVIIAGAILYFIHPVKSRQPPAISKVPMDVRAPQGSHAVITLANGNKILLDSTINGELALQGNVKLVKLANGQIAYTRQRLKASSGKLEYNTLSNPLGSRVTDMVLSDGSHVWLNAGSSITYPVAFIANKRQVTITGEAYFEVAPDAARPFYVRKGDMDIKVLGTHFNVNAYDDQKNMEVTLLEGSVRVTNPTGSMTIRPEQQAIVPYKQTGRNPQCDITVHHANIDQIMAWKKGLFDFDGINLKEAMPQIARWYAISVQYEEGVPDVPLFGKIDRNLNLSDILDLLRGAGFRFRLEEGRKLLLTK